MTVALFLPIEAEMALLDVDEKNDFVIADKFHVGFSEFCVELEIMVRALSLDMLSGAVELVKASSILDGTLRWLEASAMLHSAVDGIRVEGSELTVDVAGRRLSSISETHSAA